MTAIIYFQLLYVAYYAYVLFILYKLQQNNCMCEKLENFKKMPEFTFIATGTLLFFIYNINQLIIIFKSQSGGGNELYLNTLIIISMGYGLSFIIDIVLLKYLHMMKSNSCPCQKKHREILTYITYVKFTSNVYFYIMTMNNLDKKTFLKIMKKHLN